MYQPHVIVEPVVHPHVIVEPVYHPPHETVIITEGHHMGRGHVNVVDVHQPGGHETVIITHGRGRGW